MMVYTKEQWQGAKNQHAEKARCGCCGAPLAETKARARGAVSLSNLDPLCTACGVFFQTYRAHLETTRRKAHR